MSTSYLPPRVAHFAVGLIGANACRKCGCRETSENGSGQCADALLLDSTDALVGGTDAKLVLVGGVVGTSAHVSVNLCWSLSITLLFVCESGGVPWSALAFGCP